MSILPANAIESAIAEAVEVSAAIRSIKLSSSSGGDAPRSATFADMVNYVKFLTILGLLTPDQAVVLLKALENGDGITTLPDLPSPNQINLYDEIKSFIASKIDPAEDVDIAQLLNDVLHIIELTHLVVDAAVAAGEAIASAWHAIFG
jgi:hypothetical protein